MKKESKFLKKLVQNGFYIVLFLCISAIGISGYVMYVSRNAAEEIKEGLDIESSLNIPFPTADEEIYKTMQEEVPVEIEDDAEEKEEPAPVEEKEVKQKVREEKTEKAPEKKPVTEPVAVVEEKEVVYTMALSGAITAPFSGDELVKSRTLDDWRIHSGVDIKGEFGTDVLAISDGTVKSVATDSMMGNTVTVEHKDGLTSIYANLADDIKLKAGDNVKGGDVVGKVGNSALAECMEEAHLHLEVKKDGKNIDPLSLFPGGEE
ncbi:MAG: peptidoglycan DD-metalloendopeptidase family protein [Oscillospiraceae bacterium]|nr:peptidoglycan DD-metalloendopeptidase family protein [Oscillospiraceae bacterium]